MNHMTPSIVKGMSYLRDYPFLVTPELKFNSLSLFDKVTRDTFVLTLDTHISISSTIQ